MKDKVREYEWRKRNPYSIINASKELSKKEFKNKRDEIGKQLGPKLTFIQALKENNESLEAAYKELCEKFPVYKDISYKTILKQWYQEVIEIKSVEDNER